MISSVALQTLTSGLAVQAKAAETAADNIVNVVTPGYQAERGQVVSTNPSGASYVPLPPEGEVDLGRELVNLTAAKQAYSLAAHSFSSIAKTEKDGLDTLA